KLDLIGVDRVDAVAAARGELGGEALEAHVGGVVQEREQHGKVDAGDDANVAAAAFDGEGGVSAAAAQKVDHNNEGVVVAGELDDGVDLGGERLRRVVVI